MTDTMYVQRHHPVLIPLIIHLTGSVETTGHYLQSADYIYIKYSFRTDNPKYKSLVDKWVGVFLYSLLWL